MAIIRVQHNKDYTTINNFICKDNRLSWKAKGIWLYAFHRRDDWTFYQSEMMVHSTDGEDSFRSGIQELIKFGYLLRSKKKDSKGKFIYEWTFHETPQEIKEILPHAGFPDLDNPGLDSAPLTSTEGASIEENNNREGVVVPSDESKERLLLSSSGYEFNETVKKLVMDYSLDDIKLALSVCRHATDMIDHNPYFTSALKGKWQPKLSKEEIKRIEEETKEKEEQQQQKQQQMKLRSEIKELVAKNRTNLKDGYDIIINENDIYAVNPKSKLLVLYDKEGLQYLKRFIETYITKGNQ